jgi:Protein of unknown function (DUF1161)
MRLTALITPALAILLTILHSHTGAQALSCAELQARVEAKIRGNGVESFSVEIVEATSQAPGQVVGTCERGEKKLVYIKGKATGSAASQPRPIAGASPAPAAKPKAAPVITECADGRVITTGNCKLP